MNIAQVPAGRGIDWFKQGWALFKKAPLPFLVMGLIGVCVEFMGSFSALPELMFLLELVVCFLSPVVLAGLFWGAQRADRGEPVDIGLVFQGFREKTAPLLGLGAIMLGFLVVIILLLAITIAPAVMNAMQQTGMVMDPQTMHGAMTPEEMMLLASSIEWSGTPLLGILASLLLTALATLGLVFAIPLVLFHNLSGRAAFSLSLKANLSAWAPISVAGGLFVLLSIPALVTFVGMFLLFPVTFTALYVAQKELFVPTSAG